MQKGVKEEQEQKKSHPFSALLAMVMDECIRIPGTKLRIGLDPILGLIPGLGESIGTFLGGFILIESARAGTPLVIKLRMLVNLLLNATIGAIPFIGDAFSTWFKSNSKNYALLEKHRGQKRSNLGDYAIVFLFFLAAIALSLGMVYLLWKLIQSGFQLLGWF